MKFVLGLALGIFIGYLVLPLLPYLLNRDNKQQGRRLSLQEILDQVRSDRDRPLTALGVPSPRRPEVLDLQNRMGHGHILPMTSMTRTDELADLATEVGQQASRRRGRHERL